MKWFNTKGTEQQDVVNYSILQYAVWKMFNRFYPRTSSFSKRNKYERKWLPIMKFFGMYFLNLGYAKFPLKKPWWVKNLIVNGAFECEHYFDGIGDELNKERNWEAMYAGLRAGKGTIPPSVKKANGVIVVNNDMVFVAQYDKQKQEQTRKQRYEYLQNVKPFEVSGRWGLRVGDDIILQPVYWKIHDFVGGFAIFEIAPNRMGFLIRNGKVYYPADYQEIKILPKNRALLTKNVIKTVEVQLDTKWGY